DRSATRSCYEEEREDDRLPLEVAQVNRRPEHAVARGTGQNEVRRDGTDSERLGIGRGGGGRRHLSPDGRSGEDEGGKRHCGKSVHRLSSHEWWCHAGRVYTPGCGSVRAGTSRPNRPPGRKVEQGRE